MVSRFPHKKNPFFLGIRSWRLFREREAFSSSERAEAVSKSDGDFVKMKQANVRIYRTLICSLYLAIPILPPTLSP